MQINVQKCIYLLILKLGDTDSTCAAGDESCEVDTRGAIHRAYDYILDYFTVDEDAEEKEFDLDEDLDLWDVFRSWLWGEEIDNNDENEHVKSGKHNPGTSFKAHKRKAEEEDLGFFGNLVSGIVDILRDDKKPVKKRQ